MDSRGASMDAVITLPQVQKPLILVLLPISTNYYFYFYFYLFYPFHIYPSPFHFHFYQLLIGQTSLQNTIFPPILVQPYTEGAWLLQGSC